MGRLSKTDALKRAQGNPGKRKLAKPAKKSGTAFPVQAEEFPAPVHLSDEEKEIWRAEIRRVGNLNLLRQSDMSAFEIYVATIKRYNACKKIIDEMGMTYQVESKHGTYSRKRPEVDIEKECRRHIRDMQREFGMTSISRIRAHMVVAATKDGQPQLPLSGGGDRPAPTPPSPGGSPLGALRAAGNA
jgi:P27 family predicted phage terminase small subunit